MAKESLSPTRDSIQELELFSVLEDIGAMDKEKMIENVKSEKIEPPDPVEEDVYGFDDSRLAKFYIKTLPADLGEAMEQFKRSKLMRDTLGQHMFNKYLEVKKTEWEEFQRSVTDWELDRYKNL